MAAADGHQPTRRREEGYLRRALTLARRGRFRTSPNPMVGAVVVRSGEIVGSGYHRRVGGAHAEVEALDEAGERARGATLYVTLEPCNHHGRTPPCSERVVASGVRRVVACHADPNPQAVGGFARLRQAGIEVASGRLLEQAVRLNWRFLTAVVHRRPAVTLKWAMSLDGKIATVAGESQWISSPGGRRWGLLQREDHDAILVGSGTALADDPSLDRRLGKTGGKPNLRVVLDRRLRLPPAAKMLGIPGDVLIYTESGSGSKREALAARGATVVTLPAVEPETVLADLYSRRVQSLLVEGGSAIHGAFLAAGAFDRVGIDCAPLLISGAAAPGPVGGAGIPALARAPRLAQLRSERRDGDVILTGFKERCLQDLSASVAG